MQNKIIVIAGTTASGKTALSVELAKRYNGEIVSADSMQIYKYMNIGTAKPTKTEMQGVPHHMMDMVLPDEDFTLAQYLEGAKAAVDNILLRKKVPIITGGTGLYISSFMHNISLCEAKTDLKYREYLKTLDGITLKKMLEEVDPERAKELHENDIKRLSRALELFNQTGLSATEQRKKSLENKSPYNFLPFCLTCKDRDTLYDRINLRVDQMLEQGLENEVRNLYDKGLLVNTTAAQAIGYKEFIPYFHKECQLNTVIEKIKQESRRYAKRQLTWFRREPSMLWHYIDENDNKSSEFSLNFLSKQVEFFINI